MIYFCVLSTTHKFRTLTRVQYRQGWAIIIQEIRQYGYGVQFSLINCSLIFLLSWSMLRRSQLIALLVVSNIVTRNQYCTLATNVHHLI